MREAKIRFLDFQPRRSDFLQEVLAGLRLPRKRISPKFLYDQKGSEIFDRICELSEYYPTRTELKLLEENAREMAAELRAGIALFEFGSGASKKTRILLDHMESPASYVAIDICREFLLDSSRKLAERYPELQVISVCADYTRPIHVPASLLNRARTRAAFFPGSTIGNFDPSDAVLFLRNASRLLRPGGRLLVGVDLIKEKAALEAAYNDSEGLTAAFNLNLLDRIREELSVELDPSCFEHWAFYNTKESRVEMHLRSLIDQKIVVGGEPVYFRRGETIHTENSYKYSPARFEELVREAGYQPIQAWIDAEHPFAVYLIEAREAVSPFQVISSAPIAQAA